MCYRWCADRRRQSPADNRPDYLCLFLLHEGCDGSVGSYYMLWSLETSYEMITGRLNASSQRRECGVSRCPSLHSPTCSP